MKRALKAIAFNAIIVALLVAGLFYDKEGAMNVFAGIATVAFVLSFAMVSESNMACLKAKGKPSLPIWMNVWIDSLVAGALLWHGIVFKVLDCQTEAVALQFNNQPRTGEPHGWYVPYQPCGR
jgi:amino acid transporter